MILAQSTISDVTRRVKNSPTFTTGKINTARHQSVIKIHCDDRSNRRQPRFIDWRVAIYSAYLIIVGDLNMHLDDTLSGYTRRFSGILLDFDLVQLIKEPTHLAGHLLDVVIVPKTLAEPSVTVDPPVISDHSLISCGFPMEKDTRCSSRIKRGDGGISI